MHANDNPTDPHSAMCQRREWARAMIRKGGQPAVTYGSVKWLALQENDPARIAAVVTAAECWACESDELAGRLGAEIAAGRDELLRAEAESFAEMAADVRRLSSLPSFAELSDRRGEHDRADQARARARSWVDRPSGDAA